MKDQLKSIKAFVATAKQGSFAAAADHLGISPASMTRHVAALEKHLGVPLLVRTTRAVRLSDAGQQYLKQCQSVLDALALADEEARMQVEKPSGTLRLTAPSRLGRFRLAHIIAKYMKRYPDIRVEATFTDALVGLVEEGYDLAIRAGALPDSSMKARRLPSEKLVIVASPHYLEKHGRPNAFEDLKEHQLLSYSKSHGLYGWEKVGQEAKLESDEMNVLLCATIQGLGISMLHWSMVESFVTCGKLETILDAFALQGQLHVVYPANQFVPIKVKAFIELLLEEPEEKLNIPTDLHFG